MAVTSWHEQLASVFPDDPRYKNAVIAREPEPVSHNDWDKKPLLFTVRGKEIEFFAIGQVALALNRTSNTLRSWEFDGTIPKTPFVKPSKDPRGRRRMYSRAMVEGMIRISIEEGIFYPDKGKRISDTKFTVKVQELFKKLLKEANPKG